MAMQKLQPKVKELQNRYKNDQEKAQLEVARLYREAQVHKCHICGRRKTLSRQVLIRSSTAWLSSVCALQVNPLAGCLPTLATIPVFIGLYR